MPVPDRDTITKLAQNTKMDDIAALVSGGECVLFLGAGVHYPPPPKSPFRYEEKERPPLGTKLSEDLAKECDFTKFYPKGDVANLQRVSMCYEIAHSRAELIDKIQEAVHDKKQPSPALCALARLPFSVIITTNYDRLFETALVNAGKNPQEGYYDKEKYKPTVGPNKPTPEQPFVFKLHGDILQKRDSIVVTDEDYIQFVLRMNDQASNPIPLSLRYYLSTAPTLFVGYSLLDYNLRLLFKTLRWHIDNANIPKMYSVDLYPDPLIFDVWQNQTKYVTFIAQDVWTFVPALYQKVTGKKMKPGICAEPPAKKKGS